MPGRAAAHRSKTLEALALPVRVAALAIAIAASTPAFELHATARFMHVRSDADDDALVAALTPFAFLLGDWEAVPGRSGETGGFSFKGGAQGHVLVRTNFANYP